MKTDDIAGRKAGTLRSASCWAMGLILGAFVVHAPLDAWAGAGEPQRQLEELPEAVTAEFARLNTLPPEARKDVADAQQLMADAGKALDSQSVREARNLAAKAYQLLDRHRFRPFRAQAADVAAFAAAELQDFEAMRSWCAKAAEDYVHLGMWEDAAQATYYAGIALIKLQRYEEALSRFQKASTYADKVGDPDLTQKIRHQASQVERLLGR